MIHSFELSVADGLTIRGDLHIHKQDDNQPVLVFCHGFKGFKDWGSFPYAAEQLAARGMAVIRFNFSCNGVGQSLDEFDELDKFAINTYAREIADLQALVDALLAGNLPIPMSFDPQKLYLLGHSKGGGDAILYGATNPLVKGIITWNGIAHVNLFAADLRQEIEQNGVGYILNGRTGQKMPIKRTVIDDVDQNLEKYDLLRKVADMDQPLLIVQGDADYDRLVNGAKRLAEAAGEKGELHWIAGGGHTWNTQHPFTGPTPALEEAIEVTSRFILRA